VAEAQQALATEPTLVRWPACVQLPGLWLSLRSMRSMQAMTQVRRRTILIALASLVVVLCYGRLYVGVDLTDESLFAAMPYEYVLGNRPYIDELNVHPGQSFALITYPLVRAYTAVASQDGLVLALRHAYFAFVGGVSILSVLLLRRVVAWPWLLAGGLGYMSLAPFSVPSLSYNTLAAGFLAYGFIFGLNYLVVSHARPLLCLTGFCHAMAAVAYPPLLLVLPVFAIVLGLLRPGARARNVVWYGAGALLVLSVGGALILIIGPSNVLHAFSFNREMAASAASAASGSAKLKEVLLVGPVHLAARVAPAALLAIVAIVAGRKRSGLRRWCIALIPVAGLCLLATGDESLFRSAPIVRSVLLYWSGPFCYWSVLYIILLALYSWLVALYEIEPSDVRRCLVLWGLVPAVCAGVITAYASANGFVSSWVGLAPSVLIACIATGLAARPSAALTERTPAAWIQLAPVTAVLVAGILFQWAGAYAEAPVPQLTARVQTGPYRGLFTTRQRRALVQGLAADIGVWATREDKILFLQLSPGGYLLSAAQPAGPSVWLTDAQTNPAVRAWYAETGRTPTVVVDIRALQGAPVQRQLNLWGNAFEAVCARDAYIIYRRTSEQR